MIGGGHPLLPEILGQADRFGAKLPIFYLFARSASAITRSEKSSINTNRKSTTRFPVSPRRTSFVVPKPSKGGSKMQIVQNLNNNLAITQKLYEIGCQLLLITNRKSHTGFRLMTSVTMNNVIALI